MATRIYITHGLKNNIILRNLSMFIIWSDRPKQFRNKRQEALNDVKKRRVSVRNTNEFHQAHDVISTFILRSCRSNLH